MSDTPYTIGKLTRKRSDGSTYWSYCIVWWTEEGRKRHSLGTNDRVTADALAAKVWAGMQRRAVGTVGEVVEAYLDSLNGKYQETRKREAWLAAKDFWADRKVGEVEEAHSTEYLKWRKRAVNTMRQELSLVRTALRWGVNNRLIEVAPKVVVPDPPDTKVTHLTKEQFRTFLDGCIMPHVKLFAALAVATGGRKTALLQLQWDQVDLDRGILQLKREDSTGEARKNRATVPLNDQITPLLREAKESAQTDFVIEHRGQPVLDIKKGIALASKRSGIKAHPHMFRHSAAVWMAEDRVPMPEIASFLGHRDINVTTRVYAKYSPDYLKKAAESLTW